MSDFKQCSKCTLIKPISEFYIRGNNKYHYWCKDCCLLYNKEHLKQKLKYTNISDYNWMTINELSFLINKYNRLLKEEKNREKIGEYFNRLSLLKQRLNDSFKRGEIKYTKPKTTISTSVKILCKQLLNELDYSNNHLIQMEAEIISDILCKDLNWATYRSRLYPNILLSIIVITEIFYNYNIEIDEYKLIKKYNLDIDTFIRLSTQCHIWLNKTYWKQKNK